MRGAVRGVRNPGQQPRTAAAAEPSGVSAAGSAVDVSGEVAAAGGHRPHRMSGQPESSSSVCPPTDQRAGPPETTADAPPRNAPMQMAVCGTGSDSDRRCGTRRGHLLSAERLVDRWVSTGTTTSGHGRRGGGRGPRRFRPGGSDGTGCRTPDRSRSHPPWTPRPPAGERGRTQDRTPEAADGQSADPPIVPARYNFFYSSFKTGPEARRRHDGHRGTGLTLTPGQAEAAAGMLHGPHWGRERPERLGQPRGTPGLICPAQQLSLAEHRRPRLPTDSLARRKSPGAGPRWVRVAASSTATVANVANDSEEPSPRPGQGHHGRRPFGPGGRLPRPGTKASPTTSSATTTSSSATP